MAKAFYNKNTRYITLVPNWERVSKPRFMHVRFFRRDADGSYVYRKGIQARIGGLRVKYLRATPYEKYYYLFEALESNEHIQVGDILSLYYGQVVPNLPETPYMEVLASSKVEDLPDI